MRLGFMGLIRRIKISFLICSISKVWADGPHDDIEFVSTFTTDMQSLRLEAETSNSKVDDKFSARIAMPIKEEELESSAAGDLVAEDRSIFLEIIRENPNLSVIQISELGIPLALWDELKAELRLKAPIKQEGISNERTELTREMESDENRGDVDEVIKLRDTFPTYGKSVFLTKLNIYIHQKVWDQATQEILTAFLSKWSAEISTNK